MQIKTIDKGRRHRRELWIDEETQVAHLWVIDYPMRMGHAEVRMAGIGDVYTEREHRMKGYMRHLYEDTVAYMTDEGYDVSMLFGIPDFYTKFGYATCLPKYQFTIKTRDAEAARADARSYTSRPIEADDMPAVLALYNRQNASRTGTIIRDPEEFEAFEKGSDWGKRAETALWESARGDLLGYAVWDRNKTAVKVAEFGAQSAELYGTLLYTFAQQAVEKRCETITFYVPLDHEFAEYAQRFGTRWSIEYPRHSDGMMRILNQQPLFEKLVPLFERRLTNPQVAGMQGVLTIETDLASTALMFSSGKVRVVPGEAEPVHLSLSQDKLMQMLMGYRSVSDVLTATDVSASEHALPLLNVLFPKGAPFVWPPDYF
ncbi:MAG: GNAT family N-acetyltransferase [Anaerolineae bacterium]